MYSPNMRETFYPKPRDVVVVGLVVINEGDHPSSGARKELADLLKPSSFPDGTILQEQVKRMLGEKLYAEVAALM